MQGVTRKEHQIWLLTTILFSLFSINKTNQAGFYILLGVVLLIYIIDSKKKVGRTNFLVGKFQLHVFVFCIFCIASALWALNPSDSIEKGITVFSNLICMSILIRHYKYRENSVEVLLKSIFYGGIIVSIYTFVVVGFSAVTSMVEEGERMDNTYDNINDVAFLCAIGLIIAFYFYIYRHKTHYMFYSIPILIVFLGASSRTAFGVLLLGIVGLLYSKYVGFGGRGSFLRLIILGVFLIILLRLLMNLSFLSSVITRMEGVSNLFTGSGEVDSSSFKRQQFMLVGITVFMQNPLLGIGIANAHIANYASTGIDTYLHNNFTELLADGGIVGFMLFYYMEFYILYKIIKKKLYKTDQGKLIIILLTCFLLEDFGTVSYYTKILYFFLMICYLFVEQRKNVRILNDKKTR